MRTVAEKFKVKALMNLLTINYLPLFHKRNILGTEDWFCKYYLLFFLHKNLLKRLIVVNTQLKSSALRLVAISDYQ